MVSMLPGIWPDSPLGTPELSCTGSGVVNYDNDQQNKATRKALVWLPRHCSGEEPVASAGNARDVGLIPGSGRSPGVGDDNTLQYSCLENSMDRRAWKATVHAVTKSRM